MDQPNAAHQCDNDSLRYSYRQYSRMISALLYYRYVHHEASNLISSFCCNGTGNGKKHETRGVNVCMGAKKMYVEVWVVQDDGGAATGVVYPSSTNSWI